MVLIDYPTNGWCHMVADTVIELHTFAAKIGVKRCWYRNPIGKNHPHYDIKGKQIDAALENGAKQVTSKELIDFLHNESQKELEEMAE